MANIHQYPTRAIAQLIGPSLVTMVTLEAYNADIFDDNTLTGIFFNGNVLFVAGLAIVRMHNLWILQAPLLVTLVGWGSMALGLSRMAFPRSQRVRVQKRPGDRWWKTYRVHAAVVSVGLAISWIGYGSVA